MQMSNQNKRKATCKTRKIRHRTHDIHVLGAIQEPVHHVDARLVHDHFGIKPVFGKDAAFDADKDWSVIDRTGGTNPDGQQVLRNRGTGRQRQRNGARQKLLHASILPVGSFPRCRGLSVRGG